MSDLTFKHVTETNLARCNRWHKLGITSWSPERWFTATTGELGEVGNAMKKLFRVEDGIANSNDPGRQITTLHEGVDKIAEELADTFLYLNLLACRYNINLEAAIIKKFNETSVKYGFPERL